MSTSRPFTHLHAHTTLSNDNMFESISTTDDYIKKAKKLGMRAISISQHGTVANWASNKSKIEDSGLKYIHAIEAYVTDDDENTEKRNRDNYHLMLIAKNWEGVKEINGLSSKSFSRKDNHFYYNPRIFRKEIFETTDNVLILTACLGSPLRKSPYKDKWYDFFVENKHRVWLEVQPHVNEDQKEWNRTLLEMSEKESMRIVATNDVHHLDEEHADISRRIKHKAKNIKIDQDDEFDVWFKTKDEMFDTFVDQNVLTVEQIIKSLDETDRIIDEIEDFEVDMSHKYPKVFDKESQEIGTIDISYLSEKPIKDSDEAFKRLIIEGYHHREIDKKPKDEQKIYKDRINHELSVYRKTGSIDYMLLEWMVKKDAREKRVNPNKAIYAGYGRGSVSGSLIAYLLRITEMDSVKHGLSFERFMNPERISLADIDSDFDPVDQQDVQKYLLTHPKLHCASIMTRNTAAMKKSIKLYGKAIGYSEHEMDDLNKTIDERTGEIPPSVYEKYSDVIVNAKEFVEGSVDSFGRHAAGILVSSEPIEETVGTMTLKGWDHPVTQLDMKELDGMNWVKLDILSLKNLSLIQRAGEMAGLGYLTPESSDIVDFQDEDVWKSMGDDNLGIFQFESDRAGKILEEMFSDTTLKRIRERNPDIKYLDLLSLASAAQRPSGASYVENITQGITHDNGHEALNDFLSSTLGNLVYQEQQITFLSTFCGWTDSRADVLRRAIGKKNKEVMDREIPRIKESFIDTMVNKYGSSKDEAEDIAEYFIQVFIDSSSYGFSLNHSLSYAEVGYLNTWLRYYYPLEFTAAGLQIWGEEKKGVKFLDYANSHGITINPPKFRKSRGDYFVDKSNNAIYEGTGHIKGGNAQVGDLLYQLKDNEYDTFTDVVLDILEQGTISVREDTDYEFTGSIQEFYNKFSEAEIKEIDKLNNKDEGYVFYSSNKLGINKTKMEGLIRLGFFEEFGGNKKLEEVYNYVNKNYKPNNKTFANKQKKYKACIEFENSLDDESYSIVEQCEFELFYTGRVTSKNDSVPSNYFFVTNIHNIGKTRTTADVYSISKGRTIKIKVGSTVYRNAKFKEGDLLSIDRKDLTAKPKPIKKNGEWTKSETEKEIWAKRLTFIRKGKMEN